MTTTEEKKPIRFVLDERLDFNHFVPLKKAYIVASSYRSGSNYFCWELWRTGLLGSPAEFLNPYDALPVLMNRFKASSPGDYIDKLVARRASKNGVFGMKAHSHHFEAFLRRYPETMEVLSPVTFIHLSRRNKLAQAVSMAKALQTDFWTSRIESERPPVEYDRDLIEKCLVDVEQQESKWPRWFEENNIEPFRVIYEDLTADSQNVIRSIVEHLGVEDDEADVVQVPPTKRQRDGTNKEWMKRFKDEEEAAGPENSKGAAPAPESEEATHFFDRYASFIDTLPLSGDSATGFVGVIRLRHRYEAIVSTNRALFEGARVLDMMGTNGMWSLAALDAGAAQVVRIRPAGEVVESEADDSLEQYGVKPGTYQVLESAALKTLGAGSFDLVLCDKYFEETDPRLFFHEIYRLGAETVILDTGIARGTGPIARFQLFTSDQVTPDVEGRYTRLIAHPSHELIMQMSFMFEFQWRRIDWNNMGITNWTGVHDYQRDDRRTYLFSRAEA